ncbi:hypothetical protein [Akkermansia muciniphila]|uniref:hypothetical protein n=1 Tax=Akkermansia muciniphila TaxID=239935 RepID=UPI0011AF8102|nr:hypothetical protein [Akkermansia muciniphila]
METNISREEEVFNDNLPEEVQAFLRNYYQESGIELGKCDDRIQFLVSKLQNSVSLTFFSPKQVSDDIKKRIKLFELERRFLVQHGFLA